MNRLFLSVFAILTLSLGMYAHAFPLAKEGKALVVIVLPEDPEASTRYAGNELAKYLGKITGAKFQIQWGEDPPVTGPKILLGYPYEGTKNEEVCIRLKGKDTLEITGQGSRGTLYAVYTLLEGLGCGFWTPTQETVPSNPDLAVPQKFYSYRYAPPFVYRQPLGHTTYTREWRTKVYINGDMWMLWAESKPEHGGAHPMQMGQWAAFVPHYEKNKDFYIQREDWLAYREDTGRRTPEGLCLTHPDLIKYVAQKIIEDQTKRPRLKYYAYSLGDNDKYCQCKECSKILKKEGSASGLIIYGANEVGKLIAESAPEAKMMCLAYWPTRWPPKRLTLEPNVCVSAAMLRDFTKSASGNGTYWAMLQKWNKVTHANLYLWDYSCNFKSMITPTPYIDVMGPTFRDYQRIKIKGVFSQMSMNPLADFIDLRCWLFGKLTWNPLQDEWKLIDQWCDGACGKGAPQMKAWLRLTKKAIKGGGFGPYHPDTRPFFSPLEVLEGYKLFQEALEATKDEPEAHKQIRKQYAGVVVMMLTRYNFDIEKAARRKRITIPSREDFLNELKYDIKAYRVNVKFHQFAEGTRMDKFMELIEKGEWLKK